MSIRNLLTELGHKQPKPTTINTDNSTAAGYVNKNMRMKMSKSWDMHLHWLRDQELRKVFQVEWEKGKDNKTNYFTKHHPINHHRMMRPKYVRDIMNHLHSNLITIYNSTTAELQGCVIQPCES